MPIPKINFLLLIMLGAYTLCLSGCGSVTEGSSIQPSPTPDDLIPVEYSRLSLSGEWHFRVDPSQVGESESWHQSDFDASSWDLVDVPHTWNVMRAHSNYDGFAWYRKVFDLPDRAADARMQLRFDAVYYRADVWLNGTYLGVHEGGYTPFEFDVSGIAAAGDENTLAVRVENFRRGDRIPDDVFDWWNYGGIVRNVSLEMTSRAYIARQRIVAVPHIVAWDEADTATVTTVATIVNTSATDLEATLTTDIIDEATGASVLDVSPSVPILVPSGESLEVELQAILASPKLWHFDHPNLYRSTASLLANNGQSLHTLEDTFGVRLIELKDAQFHLNGEPMRLVGMTRHQDSPEYGLAEPVTFMSAEYDDMKRLNMVFSRPVHYPQDESVLDYCDRNGILLIPEIPAWQIEAEHLSNANTLEAAKQQLGEMIEADFNHPSVWAWSVGNEFDSDSLPGHQYVQELVEVAKRLDPTRPVGFASYRLYENPDRDATQFTDFVLMNEYCGSWAGSKWDLSPALDRIHETWPERVVIISEFGLESNWAGASWLWFETNEEDFFYIQPDADPYAEEVYVQRRKLILEQMDVFRSKPFVAGAIFWTYQDYRSNMGFHMGLLTQDRQITPIWQLIREQYAPVIINEISLSSAVGSTRVAAVSLQTRGPIESEMPVYTLRAYRLKWMIHSIDGQAVFSEGEIPLPTLLPEEKWSGEVELDVPDTTYVITVSVFRPNGFSVVERSVDMSGAWIR
jgi:beta-galactosidase/beta-glucuronidase